MKINIEIDPIYKEAQIIIRSSQMNEEVQTILNKLKVKKDKNHIVAINNERIYLLNQEEVYFFFSQNKKVFASLEDGNYEVKKKLYEIEESLIDSSFVRISKSVIANMKKVNNLEMWFNGSMCINFTNNDKQFVSRRFVSKIKDYLGIGGK